MSISIGLDIAMRALLVQQQAVDTTSHNISNATTPGYSRQRVKMVAVPGAASIDGRSGPGGGVDSLGVNRVRDLFFDFQLRVTSHSAGRFEARAQSLQQAELALGEPGDAGLRSVLSRFWNSWRDLANNPESAATHSSVTQAGSTFALTARRIHDSFVSLRNQADQRLMADISEINELTTRVASLNTQIVALRSRGDGAADLSDQRDRAIDRLARLMNINYVEQSSGSLDVFVGGSTLVTGNRARELFGDPNITNSNYIDVKFKDSNTVLLLKDGELQGLLEQRDTDLVKRVADLNTLVGQIITDTNTAHAAGFGMDGVTGRDFFTGTDASDIVVSAAVLADPNVVAASTTAAGVPGDGANASVISDLEYAKVLLTNTATYDEFYAGAVSDLGVTTREFEGLLESQELVLEHMAQVRDGASGVNIDEEMISLMQFQRAYEASARMVQVIDGMLDTLINRTI